MMVKASFVVLMAALSTADAFVAPVPRGRMTMSGKAALDTLPRVVLTHENGHEATVHLHGTEIDCRSSMKINE